MNLLTQHHPYAQIKKPSPLKQLQPLKSKTNLPTTSSNASSSLVPKLVGLNNLNSLSSALPKTSYNNDMDDTITSSSMTSNIKDKKAPKLYASERFSTVTATTDSLISPRPTPTPRRRLLEALTLDAKIEKELQSQGWNKVF
eukprot:g3434.t1